MKEYVKECVFVDSSFWIALIDQRDQNHPSAKNDLKSILQDYQLCLSDLIIFETLTYFNCSLKRHDLALRFLQKTESQVFSIFSVDEAVKPQALVWFKRYADKDLSMTDCTSFVLMESEKIQWYAGFDDHFNQIGFLNVSSQLGASKKL